MMVLPKLYPNALAQQFESLREQPEISKLLVDVLDFIEQKMLRMGPEKRATCKEFVDKFREFHQRASADEDYCLQPAPGHPKRVNTDLSTLSPHVFDATEREVSNSQSSHRGIWGGQSKSVSGVAEKRAVTEEHECLPMSRIQEVSPQKRMLEVPRGPRDFGEKRRLDHSPSTNRSSSRSTNHASSKGPLPMENEQRQVVKRRGLRQKFRSLLCL